MKMLKSAHKLSAMRGQTPAHTLRNRWPISLRTDRIWYGSLCSARFWRQATKATIVLAMVSWILEDEEARKEACGVQIPCFPANHIGMRMKSRLRHLLLGTWGLFQRWKRSRWRKQYLACPLVCTGGREASSQECRSDLPYPTRLLNHHLHTTYYLLTLRLDPLERPGGARSREYR